MAAELRYERFCMMQGLGKGVKKFYDKNFGREKDEKILFEKFRVATNPIKGLITNDLSANTSKRITASCEVS